MLEHPRTKRLQSWGFGDSLGHKGEAVPAAGRRTKPLALFQSRLAPRLHDHLIGTLRVRHCNPRTEEAYDIRTVHQLLGHIDLRTTMICAHVLNRGVRSPADAPAR
jgi:hypothetical protein